LLNGNISTYVHHNHFLLDFHIIFIVFQQSIHFPIEATGIELAAAGAAATGGPAMAAATAEQIHTEADIATNIILKTFLQAWMPLSFLSSLFSGSCLLSSIDKLCPVNWYRE
ncbi:unnamed protein product, partial [Prunus brigantina]